MTPPKIVLVCGAGYVSGKEIVALELTKGLAARGMPPHVVTSTWNDGDFIRRLRDAKISHELMPLGFVSAQLSLDCLRMTGEQLLQWPRLTWSYRQMLSRVQPTAIIHTNWHHLILLWPFLRSNRDYFWLHECVPNSPRYRRAYNRLARRIRRFICVSQAVARSLFALGIPNDKVDVIHNGLSVCVPDPVTVRSANSSVVNIGIAGQIGAWKGHEDLLHALALVLRQHPHAQLNVFGTGKADYVEQLQNIARELAIDHCVSWLGFTTDRAAIYSNLDVCVVPSRSNDPLPTTAIEAAFFGLPVIATRRGGLPEIVVDNETGILVDAESPSQLSAAICRLLADPQLHRRMSTAARAHSTSHFGEERFLADFLRALNFASSERARVSPPLPTTSSIS